MKPHERVLQFLEHGPGKAKTIDELTELTGMGSREIEDQITLARNAGALIYWTGTGYILKTRD